MVLIMIDLRAAIVLSLGRSVTRRGRSSTVRLVPLVEEATR
jgi:hypothetical protein